MDRIEKLYSKVCEQIHQQKEKQKQAVFERMSLCQLEELSRDDISIIRMKEILASVDGLWLLEGGV